MKKTFALLLGVLMTLTFTGAALAGNSPDSFTAMAAQADDLNSMGAATTQSLASVTFFNSQAAFTAAAPGLTLEDFEGSNAGPGALIGCPNSLSNSTPGSCYPSGELVDGFTFNATVGQTVVLGAGIVPVNPTTWVAADLFNAGSFFTFSDPDVFAVGFDVFSFFNAPITISVFGDGGVLLGTAIVPVGTTFFGVKADETITSVSAAAGAVAVYDNLQFGSGIIDTDGDGVPDDVDACPASDLSATVVIDGCDSGVINSLGTDGCTISDLAAMCADGTKNHGQYVSCVSHLTNDLKKAGVITGREKGAITSCAGQANLP
jgi:hypothetical protein